MNKFICVGAYAINPLLISFIHYQTSDQVVVTVGGNSLTFNGPDTVIWQSFFVPDQPAPPPDPPAQLAAAPEAQQASKEKAKH